MENNKKRTILVIEDELALRQSLSDSLVAAGFNVLQAADGVDGLSTALAFRPDLILLDILMPRMNGLVMLHRLRVHDEYGKHVPVILLSVLSPEENRILKRIAVDEPAYYLVKTDWKIDEVVGKIRERLNESNI